MAGGVSQHAHGRTGGQTGGPSAGSVAAVIASEASALVHGAPLRSVRPQRPRSDRFLPYVPALVVAWPEGVHWQERHGTLASVDLSGFTALTERLVELGRDGVEEINQIVSTIFTSLIEIVQAEGGDVLSFGGDAILVWFDAADDHRRGASHVHRGARCTVSLQRAIRRLGVVAASCGTIRLRMSIGMHTGPLLLVLVGSSQRQLLTVGRTATRTVELEAAADAGQILVSAAVAAELPAQWVGRDADGRLHLRVGAVRVVSPAQRAVPPGRRAVRPASWCAEFLPAATRDEIGNSVGEHRLVTIAFIKVAVDDRTAADDPELIWRDLDAFAQRVTDLCAAFGAMWLCTDISPGSVKFIVTAGAPISHEDDEERVLRVCHALVRDADGLVLRIGVNSGAVYFADLGHPRRRTLTTMGDAMNLAARLMGTAADGQIVASRRTLDATFAEWRTEPLSPFHVKGKRGAIHASVVDGPAERRGPAAHAQLIGRDREVAVLQQAIAAAVDGAGGTIDIEAGAGCGKSALVDGALEGSRDRLPVVTAQGDPYLAAAYRAMAEPLRRLFDVGSIAELRSLLRRHLPAQVALLPLVADAFGWDVAQTPASQRVAGEFRQERTRLLIGDLAATAITPAVLWADDVQWFDDASLGVLQALSANGWSSGLLVLCTRRPDGAAPQLVRATKIVLRPLDDLAAAAVVEQQATRSLHPHTIDAIVRRAGGHPFFLRALTAAVCSVAADAQLHAPVEVTDLPESAERAAAVVLDRLPAAARSMVRHAAVGGKSVALEVLALAVGDATLADARRWRSCREVVEVRDGCVVFRHDLYCDAAYVGLSAARRRELHGRFADVIEVRARAAGSWVAAAPVLAVHLTHARRYDAAWVASAVAARSAALTGAWRDADALWSRCLAIVPQMAQQPDDLGAALCEAALAGERLGLLPRAESLVRRASRLQPSAATSVAIARLLQRQGKLPAALRVARRARLAAATPADHAEASLRVASVLNQMGRSRSATAIELTLLADSELSRLHRGRAALQAQLSLMSVADERESRYGDLAVELLTGVECGASLGDALNNQSLAHWYAGRLVEGGRRAAAAMAEYEAVGDLMGVAIAANNLAGIWLDQGRLTECEPLLLRCLRTFEAAADRFSAACIRAALGTLAVRKGRYVEALALLEGARADFTEMGADDLVLDADLRRTEALLWRRQPDAALALADDCLQRSSRWSAGGLNTRWARRLRIWSLSQLGEAAAARHEAQQLLTAARGLGIPAELAISLATLEALNRAEGVATPAAAVRERLALMRRIGMVAVPELPVSRVLAEAPPQSPSDAPGDVLAHHVRGAAQ